MEAELAEDEALEGARDLVAEMPAAEARVDGEAAAVDDAHPLARDVVARRTRRLAVDLGDEPAERLRLALRPVDVGEHVLERAAARAAEERLRVLARDELEQELGVRAVGAPELDGHAATLSERRRCRARRPPR